MEQIEYGMRAAMCGEIVAAWWGGSLFLCVCVRERAWIDVKTIPKKP